MSEIQAGKPVEYFIEKTVSPTVDELIDSFPVATYLSATYEFVIIESVFNNCEKSKMDIVYQYSGNPKYNIYDIKGEDIPYVFNIVLDAGYIKIYLKNNSIHILTIKFIKRTF